MTHWLQWNDVGEDRPFWHPIFEVALLVILIGCMVSC